MRTIYDADSSLHTCSMTVKMQSVVQAGEADYAFQLLKDMTSRGMAPDQVTYGALMHACAVAKQLPLALSVLETMKAASMQPSAEIYTAFIDAHVKAGTQEGTQEALHKAFQVCAFLTSHRSPLSARGSAVACILQGAHPT